jgi:hypothetical protein
LYNDDLYIRRLTGSTSEWRQIIHSGNILVIYNYAIPKFKLPLAGGIMSGLIQSTSTEFFRGVSTSAYISFIMQQIQLELDIYNLMLELLLEYQ